MRLRVEELVVKCNRSKARCRAGCGFDAKIRAKSAQKSWQQLPDVYLALSSLTSFRHINCRR